MNQNPDTYFSKTGSKLISLLRKHFNITGKNENVRIESEIDPSSVESFFTEYLAFIRPKNLRPEKILPKPDSNKLRGLYIGNPTANSFLNHLVRHALYVDQILVTDPFQSIVMIDHPRNVFQEPAMWLETTVNKALAICAISDWIENDIVRLIPNLFFYHRDLLFASANKWENKGIQISSSQLEEIEEEFVVELLLSYEEDQWDSLFESLNFQNWTITSVEREYFIGEARKYASEYPIRFRMSNIAMKDSKKKRIGPSKIFSVGGGTPIHLASELANLTGSFMLFEKRHKYEILKENFADSGLSNYQDMALAFQNLEFQFLHNVPIDIALQAHQEGYLRGFRNYLRETWTGITSSSFEKSDMGRSLAFSDRLASEYADLKGEWTRIRRDLRFGAVNHGLLTGTSAVVAGNLNWVIGVSGVLGSIASAIKEYRQIARDLELTKQKPLAVFIELAKRQK